MHPEKITERQSTSRKQHGDYLASELASRDSDQQLDVRFKDGHSGCKKLDRASHCLEQPLDAMALLACFAVFLSLSPSRIPMPSSPSISLT